jgi:serine/threonine-protein kinase
MVSPGGRWMAYTSDETGRPEVYVRPFPNVSEGKWQVSREGGVSPVWGPYGRELFYRRGQEMILVSIETNPRFTQGTSRVLFTGSYLGGPGRNYDIAPDGKRFVMIEAAPPRDELIVVSNWFEELKRLVPAAHPIFRTHSSSPAASVRPEKAATVAGGGR